jgi:hypothetical protein
MKRSKNAVLRRLWSWTAVIVLAAGVTLITQPARAQDAPGSIVPWRGNSYGQCDLPWPNSNSAAVVDDGAPLADSAYQKGRMS